MCKINGKSLFYWTFGGGLGGKMLRQHNKKRTQQEVAQADAEKKAAEEKLADLNKPEQTEVEGNMPTPVVPIKTTGTGVNNTLPRIGLNL